VPSWILSGLLQCQPARTLQSSRRHPRRPRRSRRKPRCRKIRMPNTDDKPVFKITLDDLAKVQLPAEQPHGGMTPVAAGAKQYGNIATAGEAAALEAQEKPRFYLQGWFYLGMAGLVGALIGWAIGEPFFVDGPRRTLGALLRMLMIIPLVLIF